MLYLLARTHADVRAERGRLGLGAIFCPGCRSTITAEAPTCEVCGLPRPASGWPVDPQIGRVVNGKYRIDKRLSAGGFGTVFLSMQVHGGIEMGRVILKFLHPEHTQDANLRKRFLTEVKTARELINPHIVRVFDLDYDTDGSPFMVQEFIEGDGLDEILQREKRLHPGKALKIAIQVAEGMAEAHRKQIIHRDLKPENLRLQEGTGLLKILDFGIARVTTTRGTATNSFVGTPRYMPPEQIKQQGLDNGVDIFALGVITFEMLAGQPPIRTEQSELEYIHLNLIQDPRRLREVLDDCPVELSDFVHSMMEKDRARRPKDMDSVVQTLTEIAAQHGWGDDTTGRFRLSASAETSGSRPLPAGALLTRDRTPSPASTAPAEDEDVLELVPVTPKKTGLYVGIAGGTVAAILAVVLIVVLSGKDGKNAPAAGPAAGADAGAAGALDARVPAASAEAATGADQVAGADAGKPVATEAVAASDAGTPDAAAVKIVDAEEEEIRALVEAAEPDAGPAAPDAAAVPDVASLAPDRGASDAGGRRDAVGRRDTAAAPPRDTSGGPSTRDAGRPRDTGFQFTKIGGGGSPPDPFSKIGTDAH
ncbi:MAG: serine/threonine protein kinase [Deltaproteobacteria bacterium]|nr:serine/threonine protein kinase [Deltaproteobacteria bacterium]